MSLSGFEPHVQNREESHDQSFDAWRTLARSVRVSDVNESPVAAGSQAEAVWFEKLLCNMNNASALKSL